ncbi:MAG: outer membrane protein transport protein [candidate division KSB1 bacterium]|nr:outer membrane protein transport protein [candidate division KSB1 bacterium]MDZ7276502.1 outer membrane protein transport protein [candidate division KSB1 bacterium]MDZ7286717.1 outer membrane protein transport protein [candidate division KSB1 bacterium]MDZ7300272.1 outer membrane protein transport protein [candidate division KSB1 bacterium]MDZ7309404.1 outer membrane protein transport protein [candidate division KSB1 bacterium]
MKIKHGLRALLFGIGAAGLLATVHAQEEVFQRGIEFGVGGRALGMGGAYTGVGDDYSAAFWNPAALTQIRRLEGFATLSHAQRENETAFGFNRNLDKASATNFNSLGLAYPIPTYRGSLVFSLGYHRVRPYDGNFGFTWFNSTPGDSVNQRWSELEEGSLSTWTFAGATEVAPNFSLGAALNIWSGKNDYLSSFTESDVLDLYTFRSYRNDEAVVSTFSGINLKLAGLYRASSLLRLGFTLGTPATFTVKDRWESSEETEFDDGNLDDTHEVGRYQYKIRSPFSLGAGASLNAAGLLLSGSWEHNDWSQIRYTTEPPIAGLSRNEANDELARNYRATTRLRLGAEFTLPVLDVQLRAGYFRDPNPLKGLPADADREFVTAGVGIFLDKQVRLDLAVLTGQWHDYKEPLDDFSDTLVPVSEKITIKQAFASLAFRF